MAEETNSVVETPAPRRRGRPPGSKNGSGKAATKERKRPPYSGPVAAELHPEGAPARLFVVLGTAEVEGADFYLGRRSAGAVLFRHVSGDSVAVHSTATTETARHELAARIGTRSNVLIGLSGNVPDNGAAAFMVDSVVYYGVVSEDPNSSKPVKVQVTIPVSDSSEVMPVLWGSAQTGEAGSGSTSGGPRGKAATQMRAKILGYLEKMLGEDFSLDDLTDTHAMVCSIIWDATSDSLSVEDLRLLVEKYRKQLADSSTAAAESASDEDSDDNSDEDSDDDSDEDSDDDEDDSDDE